MKARRELRVLEPHCLRKSSLEEFPILNELVVVHPDTFSHFEGAGLWRRYDAPEILARLPTFFGERPAPALRESALTWAFEVWRRDPAAAKKALKKADLHVPTIVVGGDQPQHASFSGSWTSLGKAARSLFARGESRLSRLCCHAADTLLTDWDDWRKQGTTKKRGGCNS